MGRYDDMIYMDRPASKYPKMSMENRAAQFSPFAAVVGYEDKLKESERLTDEKIELSEEEIEQLNYKLQLLMERIDEQPTVDVTYFIPDERKTGGAYRKVKADVLKIDLFRRVIRLDVVGEIVEEILLEHLIDLGGSCFEQ